MLAVAAAAAPCVLSWVYPVLGPVGYATALGESIGVHKSVLCEGVGA